MSNKTRVHIVLWVVLLLSYAAPIIFHHFGAIELYIRIRDAWVPPAIFFTVCLCFGYLLSPFRLFIATVIIVAIGEMSLHLEESMDIYLIHDRPPSSSTVPIVMPLVFISSYLGGRILRFAIKKLTRATT